MAVLTGRFDNHRIGTRTARPNWQGTDRSGADMRNFRFNVVVLALTWCTTVAAQQLPDRSFRALVRNPEYAVGRGPFVCVDEAHTNFHTLEGRFAAFGQLLRQDGYQVRPIKSAFDSESLSECHILVVCNAQPGSKKWNDYPYPTPSAFTDKEIEATRRWVGNGGSLLLIADHITFSGAAAELAAAFGVEFTDSFAVDTNRTGSKRQAARANPTLFQTGNGTLKPHEIVRGRQAHEVVTQVRTFTGQAFRARGAEPLLVLPSSFEALMPRKAWKFGPATRRFPAGGWLQGGVMQVGAGRAAFFGEAAMFTAQISGAEQRPMGMNAPGAEQNSQFVLNLMHWLSPR